MPWRFFVESKRRHGLSKQGKMLEKQAPWDIELHGMKPIQDHLTLIRVAGTRVCQSRVATGATLGFRSHPQMTMTLPNISYIVDIGMSTNGVPKCIKTHCWGYPPHFRTGMLGSPDAAKDQQVA